MGDPSIGCFCYFMSFFVLSLRYLGAISKWEHLLPQLSFFHVLVLIMRHYYSRETFHKPNIVSKSAYLHFSWAFLWHTVFGRKHLSLGFLSLRGSSPRGTARSVHTDTSLSGTGQCARVYSPVHSCTIGRKLMFPSGGHAEVWSEWKCPQRIHGECLIVTPAKPVARTESSVIQRCYHPECCYQSELQFFEGSALWEVLINQIIDVPLTGLIFMELLCQKYFESRSCFNS